MTAATDFWSRRKARVTAEARATDRQAQAVAPDDHANKTDAELCADLDLPDPDTLKPGDDVRAFMEKAVPERLRRRALRQLWRTNPTLANLDGLVDYGEDFTDSACVIEGLQTAYQVGKGMLAHVEEMTRQAEAEAEAKAATALPATAEEPPTVAEEAAPAHAADGADGDAAEPYAWSVASPPEADAAPPTRHRMRFAFGDTAGARETPMAAAPAAPSQAGPDA